MTPVREAIRRLTAEGALSLQGNRRVGGAAPDARISGSDGLCAPDASSRVWPNWHARA